MTADEYRTCLDRLGLTQGGAADLVGADPRSSRRWACNERDVPEPVARILRYLIATGITPEEFARASAKPEV